MIKQINKNFGIILLIGIMFLTSVNFISAEEYKLYCLGSGQTLDFSQTCNPSMQEKEGPAQICVHVLDDGKICSANPNECNSLGLGCSVFGSETDDEENEEDDKEDKEEEEEKYTEENNNQEINEDLTNSYGISLTKDIKESEPDYYSKYAEKNCDKTKKIGIAIVLLIITFVEFLILISISKKRKNEENEEHSV